MDAKMFLISVFPRPRETIGVWVQSQWQDESKPGTKKKDIYVSGNLYTYKKGG